MVTYIIDLETTGLNPIEKLEINGIREIKQNKIICISILNLENNELKTFLGENEKDVLYDFWKYVGDDCELIGFNINFDLNFLYVRSFLNNIKINIINEMLDVRKLIYKYSDFGVGKLSELSELTGLKSTTSNGSQMLELYNNKNWNEIKRHCEEDILLTKHLFDRCKFLNFIK